MRMCARAHAHTCDHGGEDTLVPPNKCFNGFVLSSSLQVGLGRTTLPHTANPMKNSPLTLSINLPEGRDLL